jgi:hypothetical protein
MEHSKHIIRAVLLVVVIAVAFVLVRHVLYPKSFGWYGHYRFDSVQEYADQAPVHGAPGACAECHDEQTEALAEGKHGSVSCEVCHGPLAAHVRDDEKFADMRIVREKKPCLWCHQYLISRPKDFPQVKVPGHAVEQGADMSETICVECHNAHNPSE